MGRQQRRFGVLHVGECPPPPLSVVVAVQACIGSSSPSSSPCTGSSPCTRSSRRSLSASRGHHRYVGYDACAGGGGPSTPRPCCLACCLVFAPFFSFDLLVLSRLAVCSLRSSPQRPAEIRLWCRFLLRHPIQTRVGIASPLSPTLTLTTLALTCCDKRLHEVAVLALYSHATGSSMLQPVLKPVSALHDVCVWHQAPF